MKTDLSKIQGQVAIVTGGGRGIGRAVALALGEANASVAVVARSVDQLDETVSLIEKAGGRALALSGDVVNLADVSRIVEEVQKTLGPVDLLVNNAGEHGPVGPIWEVDARRWWDCMSTNLLGSFLFSKAVLSGMVARRRGRIINMASNTGLRPLPYGSAYAISKTALIRLGETVAVETKEYGISVFSITPGIVRTALLEGAIGSEGGQKWLPQFRQALEEGRDLPPEYTAQMVLLLASGKADPLSGCFISVRNDIEKLVGHAEEIRHDSLYTLRLRTADGSQ